VWLDTATLNAQSVLLADWAVGSLALSPDGSKLYVVNDAGKIAEVSMTGQHVATTFGGGPGQPLALIRVEAPVP
jgi:DNA-binding beta-propeller fold protein YncE